VFKTRNFLATLPVYNSSVSISFYSSTLCISSDICRTAYGALLDCVTPSNMDQDPSSLSSQTPSTVPNLCMRADYLNVHYWLKIQWIVDGEAAKGTVDPLKSRDIV